MSLAASVVVLADASGAYWFAGILTLVTALIVMVVMLSESKKGKAP